MNDHEPSSTVKRRETIDIEPHEFQALNALLHWLKGYEAASTNGRVPGHFELLMLYRKLMHGEPMEE